MSEDVYELPLNVDGRCLQALNSGFKNDKQRYSGEYRFREFMRVYESVSSFDYIHKIIKACRSGKKIVNPLSPKDELGNYYTDQKDEILCPSDVETRVRAIAIRKGIRKAVEIIAKEHPDVAEWLKEDDPND